MADGEDAAVDAVQPADTEPMLDRAASEAGVDELSTGDDAVLARGERRDDRVCVRRVELCTHHMH
jgi:hypothetical protein